MMHPVELARKVVELAGNSMKTLKKVEIIPVNVEYIPEVDNMEENVLYISEKYHTASHRCLCGCGGLTVTPLNRDDSDNYGWWLTVKSAKVSLLPSIYNHQLPCKSHYIITNNIANFV